MKSQNSPARFGKQFSTEKNMSYSYNTYIYPEKKISRFEQSSKKKTVFII